MADPAATFSNNYPPSVRSTAWSSPLAILHKDWTKSIARPFSVQSVIDGDTANNAYSVNLAVPNGSTHVGLHWVNQFTLSSSSATVSSCSAKIGTGSVTTHVLRVYGRIPIQESTYLYGPSEAGLASAVAIDNNYGYWRPLFNINLTVNSSSALWDLATSAQTYGLNYKVSSTKRLVISPMNISGLISGMAHSYDQQPIQGAATTQTSNRSDAWDGLIPLKGSDRIMMIPEYFGTAESTTFTNTATSGTVTATDLSAVGATFHF
jgi:hypothetical protein